METLIKADIFFFISSLSAIIVAVFVCVLLFYLIRVIKSFSNLLEMLKGDYNDSGEYVSELRDRLESNMAFRLLFPPIQKHKKPKAKARKSDSKKEETV